jgi:hypothetical protein
MDQLMEPAGGSQATLRPTSSSCTRSVSEFSVHSGEPELEFDLYDCDIDNVMRVPGSMFAAPAYWDEAATPTLDLEMVQLFPRDQEEEEGEVICRNNRREQVQHSLGESCALENNKIMREINCVQYDNIQGKCVQNEKITHGSQQT